MNDLIRFAFALDGPQAGQALDEAAIVKTLRDDTLAWVHLPADDPRTHSWITSNLDYLDPHAINALLAEETRPRASIVGEGMLLILRGVNVNEGEDPEDMVSIRIWADRHRIVTLSRRRIPAVEKLAEACASDQRPYSVGTYTALLVELLNAQIDRFVGALDDRVDDVEQAVIDRPSPTLRSQVLDTRLEAITFRRHIAPQREALAEIIRVGGKLLSSDDLGRLHEAYDRLTRMVETLDEMRERLSVLRDELASQLSERINRNMYLLSILSAVFLPLSFFTGLFGINVGGIPGAHSGAAFFVFVLAMMVIAIAVLGYLRWKRWF